MNKIVKNLLKKTIRLYMDEDLYNAVVKFAKAEGRSLTNACCMILKHWLKKNGWLKK